MRVRILRGHLDRRAVVYPERLVGGNCRCFWPRKSLEAIGRLRATDETRGASAEWSHARGPPARRPVTYQAASRPASDTVTVRLDRLYPSYPSIQPTPQPLTAASSHTAIIVRTHTPPPQDAVATSHDSMREVSQTRRWGRRCSSFGAPVRLAHTRCVAGSRHRRAGGGAV